jgi:hypothetical protein
MDSIAWLFGILVMVTLAFICLWVPYMILMALVKGISNAWHEGKREKEKNV